MSSVGIITTIIVLLAALVCYAFIAQTLEQRRQKKERLLAGMKTRARNFQFILQNTPGNYLPKELKLLVEQNLAQIYEQLATLEPDVKTHQAELARLREQIAQTHESGETTQKKLESPQQARDIKACLEELYRYAFVLESRRSLNRSQAETYRGMIRQAAYELTADSYVIHGRSAQEKEKPRLAIHYYELALKLLVREGRNGQFDKRIAQLKAMIAEQESELPKATPPASADAELPTNEEWENFAKADQSWKKKQIYD